MLSKKITEVGSLEFHIYNVFYLTTFTGIITFLMLFVYYVTFEPPNPLKDVQDMLGKNVTQYKIEQKNLTKQELSYLPPNEKKKIESYFYRPILLRFYIKNAETDESVMTVFSVSSGGFGGLVRALVGTDGKRVLGLRVLDAGMETPGLGQRVAEKSFQRQFINKTVDELPMDRTQWMDLDMISGASFSSSAVVENIIKAFDLYNIGGMDQ